MGVSLPNDEEGTAPGPTQPLARAGRILPAGCLLSGTYEVKGLLGEGGMGQVFEAHDVLLNRRVAIKVAWPGPDLPSVRKEAQALAIIQHPSLPQVFALGVHEGREYLVMERVYGVSLRARLQRWVEEQERLPVAEAVALIGAVAEALEVVHSAGVVHRDVKPSNIMIAPRGRVVLMDFGTVLPACNLGHDRRLMGTAEYLSPEAITDRVQPASAHLIDLYALGVLAFELLTGAPPFHHESARDTLLMHLERPVPDVRLARPDVPPGLARLVQDLLAKSPEDRPAGADEVLLRLRTPEAGPEPRPFELLVVDDHRQLAQALAAAARHVLPSLSVRIAGSGEEALQCIEERCPDLLAIDLELPGVNGLEVCMYLQGSGRRVPIVVVSGKAQPPDVQLLTQLGVQQLIPKTPGYLERFRAALTEAVRRGRTP